MNIYQANVPKAASPANRSDCIRILQNQALSVTWLNDLTGRRGG